MSKNIYNTLSQSLIYQNKLQGGSTNHDGRKIYTSAVGSLGEDGTAGGIANEAGRAVVRSGEGGYRDVGSAGEGGGAIVRPGESGHAISRDKFSLLEDFRSHRTGEQLNDKAHISSRGLSNSLVNYFKVVPSLITRASIPGYYHIYIEFLSNFQLESLTLNQHGTTYNLSEGPIDVLTNRTGVYTFFVQNPEFFFNLLRLLFVYHLVLSGPIHTETDNNNGIPQIFYNDGIFHFYLDWNHSELKTKVIQKLQNFGGKLFKERGIFRINLYFLFGYELSLEFINSLERLGVKLIASPGLCVALDSKSKKYGTVPGSLTNTMKDRNGEKKIDVTSRINPDELTVKILTEKLSFTRLPKKSINAEDDTVLNSRTYFIKEIVEL